MLFAANFVPPADANVLNVTDAVYGAVPDDGQDDTAAIQAAIIDAIDRGGRYGHPQFVYLPDGVYDVNDTLESRIGTGGFADGWRAGMILYGQSRDNTVIRLMDNTPGFTDPANHNFVILTGSENQTRGGGSNPDGGGNEAFRHSIYNLTVDVGEGNAGAVGIHYQVSNRGSIEDVLIKGSSTSGRTGLLLTRETGPGLIKDVEIRGFDFGVRVRGNLYSMTFSGLTLIDQDITALNVYRNYVTIENLTSVNSVPVIELFNNQTPAVNLIGADLTNTGTGPAIVNGNGTVYLRDVTTNGYDTVVDNLFLPDVAGGPGTVTLDEYSSQGVTSLYGDTGGHLTLPIEPTPEYHNDDLSVWKSVAEEGATGSGFNNNDQDDIQDAIDKAAAEGKDIVYLPNGRYDLGATVFLRGSVKKLIGFEAELSPRGGFPGPLLQIEDGDADTVILEHLRVNGEIVINTDRTVVIRHADYGALTPTANATGKVFLEDVIAARENEFQAGQLVWARQYNTEFGVGPNIRNDGGDIWILGTKIEGRQTHIENNGGRVEVLGGFFYPINDPPADRPMIVNNDGELSISFHVVANRFDTLVVDTRDGETRTLFSSAVSSALLGPNDVKRSSSGPLGLFRSARLQLTGDFNGNGSVEQGDLDLVLQNWGQLAASVPMQWTQQRPTTGAIDQDELDAVLQNWGSQAAAPSADEVSPLASADASVSVSGAVGWVVADAAEADRRHHTPRARSAIHRISGHRAALPTDRGPERDSVWGPLDGDHFERRSIRVLRLI